MKKQIGLMLSGIILVSLFAGCSQVIIYKDYIEGCKTEYIIYEELYPYEEYYNDCIHQSQLIQREGCNAYCQDDCDECEGNKIVKNVWKIVWKDVGCMKGPLLTVKSCVDPCPQSLLQNR